MKVGTSKGLSVTASFDYKQRKKYPYNCKINWEDSYYTIKQTLMGYKETVEHNSVKRKNKIDYYKNIVWRYTDDKGYFSKLLKSIIRWRNRRKNTIQRSSWI